MDHTGHHFNISDKPAFYAALKELRQSRERTPLGRCMYWKEPCLRPINSHSISRSWLALIAEESHVTHFRLNADRAPYEPTKVVAYSESVNKASVFPGFCQPHDSELFSVFEKQLFTASKEQLILLAYRSICREACAKFQVAGFQINQGMIEDVPTPHGMRTLREMYWCIELLSLKQALEEAFETETFNALQHYVVRLARTPKILVSTAFIPLLTATGRKLENRKSERLILNIVPTSGGGFVVFSWMSDAAKNPSLFVKSMRSLSSAGFTDFLVKLVVEVSDNSFLAPQWWQSLPDRRKDNLLKRYARNLTMGDDSPPADLFKMTGPPIGDWEIKDRWMVG